MSVQVSNSSNDTAHKCRLCDGEFGNILRVREMMFGTRESFRYCECKDCGCLQIETIPKDVALYYGKNYYSYDLRRHKGLKRWRRGMRRRWTMTGPRFATVLLRLFSSPDPLYRTYRSLHIRLDDHVLDVGTGSGGHVLDLRDAGVSNAVGVDPFIERDVKMDDAVLVYRRSLDEMTGSFDLITFHHSLEHMPDQLGALSAARHLLALGGRVLVRIPTVSSEAYQTYRENWVNLDAPRHFFLHSHTSLELVASRAGLKVDRLWCDSTDMQFIGSEQYLNDIPLTDPRSAAVNKRGGIFTASQRRAFARKAERVNRALRGDSICAVLTSTEVRAKNG